MNNKERIDHYQSIYWNLQEIASLTFSKDTDLVFIDWLVEKFRDYVLTIISDNSEVDIARKSGFNWS